MSGDGKAESTGIVPTLVSQGRDSLLRRIRRQGANARTPINVLSVSERASAKRLIHEYELAQHLDRAWALHPLELAHENGQSTLILEDPGGELLSHLLDGPMDVGTFLGFAISITVAVSRMHQHGLVHKDLKPANILLDPITKRAWLTGFGIASRLPRERQVPAPPEFIAGTLAYMAPEQTGRMNRSIDSRTDLYALGVTFYQMLTGGLPFDAVDAMEWIHCHVARQPTSPTSLVPTVPLAISAIVVKLLAKAAEDRYQTAIGLEHDLRRCLMNWQTGQRVDSFVLGELDVPSRLLLPEKLYGREHDINTLLAAFDGVLTNGMPELVLVSGYSGIGKSAVVNELHKVLAPPRGLFASGKFDQYKRDIPYATLAQAFQSILRQLLGEDEAELSRWRDKLIRAIEPNGLLIADLIPELKLIIGPQPAVSELPPQDAKSRFHMVFRRFIAAFARPEHPLVLFLDDLQWVDVATLDLIENLLTQQGVSHLLLIGAYRDNEVGPEHPLMGKIEIIAESRANMRHISLAALDSDDLTRLVTDSLRCEPQSAAPLARLIFNKTAGNPFFAIQFISALVDEGLLVLDYARARWCWDLTRIEAKGYTDNVANLVVGRLNRLPVETRQALQELACLGNSAQVTLLVIIHGGSEKTVHEDLWDARHDEFVIRSEDSYRFAHDRVQEAAYSLISKDRRAETHLRIGRLLTSRLRPAARDEVIFNIVAQFDAGSELITSRDERELVAELNLIAGKRAKASAAHASALKYLVAGAMLLADDRWERRHSLAFELEMHQAECEFLTGIYDAAHQRLTMLSSRAVTPLQQSAVACLCVDLYVMHYQTDLAIAAYLRYLAQQGIKWSAHPTDEEVRREYEEVYRRLGDRIIEDMAELPLMTDPVALATIDVLAKVIALTGMLTDGVNIRGMIVGRMTNLSLQYGNSDGSCLAYVLFGLMARTLFGNLEDGSRFARLGFELVEKRNLKRFQGRTYRIFAEDVSLWTEHIGIGCDLLRQGFEAAKRTGEAAYAAYIVETRTRLLLASGQPLAEVQLETEMGLEFATAARVEFVVDLMSQRLEFIRALRGLTANVVSSSSPGEIDAAASDRNLVIDRQKLVARYFFRMGKLKACYHAGDYPAALDASRGAKPLLSIPTAFVERAEYHFYTGLCHAALVELAGVEGREQHMDALLGHQRQIAAWSVQCPDNFECRAVLLSAEVARIEGRELDAQRMYERAIHLARVNRFHQNEAIANELAGRFYLARGFERIGDAYFREARNCYSRWGAESKVRQLDRIHPYLATPEGQLPAIIGSPIQHLDVASVVKASQALSSEIVLSKLIERLMTIAIENAGADRGLLILPSGNGYLIQAEARATADQIEVTIQEEPISSVVCPESLVRYVVRTTESVILDDASKPNPFSGDRYLRDRQSKSILCLPLMKQRQLIGVLLLENTLTSHVFTAARISVLELLAAQAAISLENTRLYSDLQEREAKIRRLVDANIIGIYIIEFGGRIIEANDAFLGMLGYERRELVSGHLSWMDLTPPEWHAHDALRVEEVKTTGCLRPFEKEYLRKDGRRVPVLVGVARIEETKNQAVAFVIDLTERKRAEAELAHANRVATMGQLSASIAHEVNQPLAALLTNAETAVRWLVHQPPNLEKAKPLIDRVIGDGRRAADIVSRIRDFSKKAPARREYLDINEAILDIMGLTRVATSQHSVSVTMQLSEGLPRILGDWVQLQQVVLNLIMNAIEAMSEVSDGSRELLISTGKVDAASVFVTVMDTGPGLPQANVERLFEAFYTTKASGLGMGLSICRQIVEAHDGRLWATPNEPRGAVFRMTLPIRERSPERRDCSEA
ncbi:ATP-binding sensor histidine kinase [Bradyrhizobium sp. CB2312]|uniref:trifunctional serine/threonine-protein kinase/ATP-binding protein/sensor histidine kinase n=1 Tax=Bradyrhizobium sp. CB2312 TaxID=3039155 RepID=UPI0024B1C3A5|nr:ATP-binding sensor histidine kinase [Bradyrhizobium sp. CB2312]WFU73413.1 AAA family ATPase [Bradyrhizobium sp. CB2312]